MCYFFCIFVKITFCINKNMLLINHAVCTFQPYHALPHAFWIFWSFVMWMKALLMYCYHQTPSLLEKPTTPTPQQNNLKRDFDYVKSFGVNCLCQQSQQSEEKGRNPLTLQRLCQSYTSQVLKTLKESCSPFGQIRMGWFLAEQLAFQVKT